MAVINLKLLCFWVCHQKRTFHYVSNLLDVTRTMLANLKEQKKLEETWLQNNKEPEYSAVTLDASLAPKVLEKVKAILTRIRGTTYIPLA
jgi:hypothetical protein